MKVLFLTDQIYLHGGLERVIANKVKVLSKLDDISVHICTINQQNKMPVYGLEKHNANFHNLDISYNKNKSYFTLANIKKLPRHLIKIHKYIRQLNPDIIIVCNYTIDFYLLPFIKRDALLIKEYHSSRYEYHRKRLLNKNILKKIFYKTTDYFQGKYDFQVLLNRDEKEFYLNKNLKVIPNFITEKSEKKSELNQKIAIAAGRLAPVKGFDEMLEIWKDVTSVAPDWKLEIYGEGEPDYIDYLQNQIKLLKLTDKVALKGATNDLKNKMLQSSMYLMTSVNECFPMVLLEALDLGLPIISYNIPTGPKNIISDDKEGYLIEDRNKEGFVIKVLNLIQNQELRQTLGTRAKKRAEHFYADEIIEKWLYIYNYK